MEKMRFCRRFCNVYRECETSQSCRTFLPASSTGPGANAFLRNRALCKTVRNFHGVVMILHRCHLMVLLSAILGVGVKINIQLRSLL